ncbi:hypothetical protein C3488_39615, partial [Streptomyces sp. Ru72]
RNNRKVHSVLAVLFQRNLDHRNNPTDGVSTYLALTFGTLLSSQGTNASFVLTGETLSAFLRALPFGVSNSISVFPSP